MGGLALATLRDGGPETEGTVFVAGLAPAREGIGVLAVRAGFDATFERRVVEVEVALAVRISGVVEVPRIAGQTHGGRGARLAARRAGLAGPGRDVLVAAEWAGHLTGTVRVQVEVLEAEAGAVDGLHHATQETEDAGRRVRAGLTVLDARLAGAPDETVAVNAAQAGRAVVLACLKFFIYR